MGYANIQADSNFYRQSLNADGIKDVTGPYTSLYEDVFRAITVTTDSVVSVTSYVGDSLSNQFLFAGTEIYGLFSSVTIHSGNAILHLAGASYISEIVNQYSASGIPLGFYEEGTQCLSQKISALLTQGVFDDASWVMVPSQYEEDWVRAFKPTSELGNLAFTRSSDATFTDSTGVVRRSPWNLLQQSNTFSNAIWSKAGTPVPTLTAGELGRDGLNNAWRVQWGAAANTSYVLQSVTITNHTASIYIKGTAGQRIRFGIGANIGQGNQFDLDGTWQRLTFSATSGSMVFFSNYSVTGTVASDFLIQDAQLAEGTEALPYFATTDRLNVPRLDYRNADGTLSTCPRLLLEPQRTNSIRNSSMVGAVAGSPGTLPTNWNTSTAAGLTQTVVATGIENGLPYIDFRFNGVASGTELLISTESINQIAAATAQTWTNSFYLKIIAQPNPPVAIYLNITERTSAGTFVTSGNSSGISVTSSLNRFSFVRTLSGGATVAAVQPRLGVTLTISSTYDFTIRIAAPQMELGAYATTWVPTTTAAVTRIADAASKTGVSSLIGQTEGTWFCEIDLSKLLGTTARDFFVIGDGRIAASASTVYCSFSGIGSNLLRARVVQSGVVKYDQRHTITATGTYKIALAYKSQNCAMYVNGSFVGTVAQDDPFAISLNQIFTSFDSSTNQFADGIAQAALFPTRLDNATLAAITTL